MGNWRVYGDSITTGESLGSGNQISKSQAITIPRDSLVLAIRSWFIFFNNPLFTDISLRLYSLNTTQSVMTLGTPPPLVAQSAVRLKSSIFRTNYSLTPLVDFNCGSACREIYFEFNAPKGVPLKGGDSYFIVPILSGYTGDASSHVAWRRGWFTGEQVYAANPTYEKLAVAPFVVSLIDSDFA